MDEKLGQFLKSMQRSALRAMRDAWTERTSFQDGELSRTLRFFAEHQAAMERGRWWTASDLTQSKGDRYEQGN